MIIVLRVLLPAVYVFFVVLLCCSADVFCEENNAQEEAALLQSLKKQIETAIESGTEADRKQNEASEKIKELQLQLKKDEMVQKINEAQEEANEYNEQEEKPKAQEVVSTVENNFKEVQTDVDTLNSNVVTLTKTIKEALEKTKKLDETAILKNSEIKKIETFSAELNNIIVLWEKNLINTSEQIQKGTDLQTKIESAVNSMKLLKDKLNQLKSKTKIESAFQLVNDALSSLPNNNNFFESLTDNIFKKTEETTAALKKAAGLVKEIQELIERRKAMEEAIKKREKEKDDKEKTEITKTNQEDTQQALELLSDKLAVDTTQNSKIDTDMEIKEKEEETTTVQKSTEELSPSTLPLSAATTGTDSVVLVVPNLFYKVLFLLSNLMVFYVNN